VGILDNWRDPQKLVPLTSRQTSDAAKAEEPVGEMLSVE
jgi:hypothetical protein